MSNTEPEHITVAESLDGDPIRLPTVEVLTGRAFITGKSGSGKSNTASVVIEELLEDGHPTLIVDTDGEYWGLKERYEILHVGAGDDVDLQVGPEHASKLADLALEERVPIILDVSEYLDEDTADDLVRETARELFKREKRLERPFLLVVEECHEYIPEGGGLDDTGKMLIRVAKRGRKRGLGIMGISQRPANVKKDFITQCEWIAWHRLTWENDTKVVRRVLDTDTVDSVNVKDLADGQAFLQADWRDRTECVQFRRKRTHDAGARPGLDEADTPELKSIGEDLQDQLEEISAERQQRQSEIERLRAEIEEKEDRIAELERELDNQEAVQSTFDRMAEAMLSKADSADEGETVQQTIQAEVMEVRQAKQEVEAELDETRAELDAVREERDEQQAEAERLRERLSAAEDRLEAAEMRDEAFDEAAEHVRALVDVFDVDADVDVGGADGLVEGYDEAREEVTELRGRLQDAHERIDSLEAENERLREAAEEASGVIVPTDYEDFVDDETVREQIAAAKDANNVSERYVKAIAATILEAGEAVTFGEIEEYPDASSRSHISRAANQLAERRVITLDESGDEPVVDFNIGGIREVKEQSRRLEKREELMEQL